MKHDDDTDARELYAERAAIMEYDAGMPRHAAEFYACVAVWRYCERTGAAPPRLDDYRLLHRHFTASTPREPSEKGDGEDHPPSLLNIRACVHHRCIRHGSHAIRLERATWREATRRARFMSALAAGAASPRRAVRP